MEIIEKSAGTHSTKLILVDGGIEVGFLTYSDTNLPYNDYMEIHYLRVNPNFRRKGYGKILMDEFFKRISSYVRDIMLYATANYDVTSLSNWFKKDFIPQDKLEEFYKKYGFKEVDPWKNETFPRMRMTKS